LDLAARTAGALPQAITVDNGPEFAGKVLDAWDYANEVQLDFIRLGKPTENGYIESFNGKLRAQRAVSNKTTTQSKRKNPSTAVGMKIGSESKQKIFSLTMDRFYGVQS
ncbi:transposase family protein, partial [Cerasicoccus arenae]|nr:transposase family protein [Cerasicoccus arenae]